MILLNKEQIKYLHSKMIQETGGSNGKNYWGKGFACLVEKLNGVEAEH